MNAKKSPVVCNMLYLSLVQTVCRPLWVVGYMYHCFKSMNFFRNRNEHQKEDWGKCKDEKKMNVNTSLSLGFQYWSWIDLMLENCINVYLRSISVNVFLKTNYVCLKLD